jgi:superfamily II DNA or RNA helicase
VTVAVPDPAAAVADTPVEGQLVEARGRRFVVAAVERSDLDGAAQHLVTLSSVEDDATGEELRVIWEIEPGARTIEHLALPEPTSFDSPRRLDAFLDAVRWGVSSSADVRALLSPFRSGIQIEDYQLDPLVRALRMPRVSLLVADDVGLGKTIEAGLVAQELTLRHRARRILIVAPASLLIQWRDQMRDKFGLEFRIVDGEYVRELRRSRGLHVNPWASFPRLITSIDYLKRARPLRLFRETLPKAGEDLYPRRWDLLILDEAHNAAPAGNDLYSTDSLRTRLIREIAPHVEHRLFLTATPHNGYQQSFSALLELLDDQRFARGVPPSREQLSAVMVRRLKDEVELDWKGERRFAPRRIRTLEVEYSDDERQAHADLRRYGELRLAHATSNAERLALEFVLKLLKKRLFSSPAAFLRTLRRHRESLATASRERRPDLDDERILRRQIESVEEEFGDDDAFEQATDDALDSSTRLFREPSPEEVTLLDRLQRWAERASSGGADSKASTLLDYLEGVCRPGGRWSDERVIVFTEYRDTQAWLLDVLAARGLARGERVMLLHGGLTSDEREAIKGAFQVHPDDAPVRILLATDAASEGIDLQNHCNLMVHYEIPWNPNRLEQRNGRIDRHGQRRSAVYIHHFVGAGFDSEAPLDADTPVGQLEGDLEFLARAALKVQAIREDLGRVGPVIAEQVEEAMLGGGRRRLDTAAAERAAEPAKRLVRLERDVRAEIARLREQYEETVRDLRLGPDNIEAVVREALELAGQPPLVPGATPGTFALPPMSGAWARAAEGLRHPYLAIDRPIAFDRALVVDDRVVLAHLNHRLVQMCLRLLRAEVWATGEGARLSRVTARVSNDPALRNPVVVAHARLVLTGAGGALLHEEVLAAGGELREGRFARLNVGQTAAALAAATDREPSEGITGDLAAYYPRHRDSLRSALEVRMLERVQGLQRRLEERRDREIADLAAVLSELRENIATELRQPEHVQLELFNPSQREQYQRDIESLRARADEIPAEIERETASIRARFADPTLRLFPVAVTYLVPATLAR